MTEAPSPPGSGSGGGRQASYKKPRQFQPHWLDFMEPLPSQILSPMRDARDARRSVWNRTASLNNVRQQLHVFVGNMQPWMDDVYALMDRRGASFVDPNNPLEADAFLARLSDSGRAALAKCDRVRAAIAYAEMTIEWFEWELAHGD